MIPGFFYNGKNNIKVEDTVFPKIYKEQKKVEFFNTSADLLKNKPSNRMFGVGVDDKTLYYYTDKWNIIVGNQNNIKFKDVTKDVHYVTSANRIYNVQSYVGGLESMYNISAYNKNIGIEFTSYGIFDDEMIKICLEDISGINSSNIIITNNLNGISEVLYQNINGDITQISNNNLNDKIVRIVVKDSEITIKILNLNNILIDQILINEINDFSKVIFYLPPFGNYDRSISVPNIWSGLNNIDSNRFLNGLIPLNSGKQEDWL